MGGLLLFVWQLLFVWPCPVHDMFANAIDAAVVVVIVVVGGVKGVCVLLVL